MSSLPLTCRKLMRRHHNRLLTRTWEAGRVGTGSGVCGAVREMEVGWPSGASLRGAASKHRALRPLRRFVVSGTEKAVASRRVELLQAELDCIRWLDVLADFGPDGVSQDPGGQDCEHVAQAGDGPADAAD